jgi:hypothetical protein
VHNQSGTIVGQVGIYDNGDSWTNTYNNGVLSSYTYNDLGTSTTPYVTYTNTYDGTGSFTGQSGTTDDGNTYSLVYANGTYASETVVDANSNESWSHIDYTNYNIAAGQWETELAPQFRTVR